MSQYGVDGCKTEKEAYECNCQSRNNARSSHMINPQFNIQDPSMYSNSEIDIVGPHRTVMMTRGNNPSVISNQLMFFDSEEAREAEGRHHKKHNYAPINFNVQFPAYGSDNVHKYYQSQYYTNPISYTYPSSNTYGAYGNYAGTSYPINYDFQASASNVPSVTVNAGGPFYGRESHHTDDSLTQSNKEMLPEEVLSTATERINASNSKRDTDIQ
ncbi:PREDICTED: uncharacterized protein LOC105455663 [Wasmannia auropunctata]|uniref:uncharacterized protein LOC105455663 n=1 Tax=Wasmannia auropunctata TaxID=64793 RepID=UPI0005EEBC5C|nr:PREDICTED: uncharacterized protein LOC105455663 [Wasmannia auropunctata]